MKKNIIRLALLAITTIMITACGGKKEQKAGWEEVVDYTKRDSTIYGLCTDGSSMNMLQILTDSGDTLTLNTLEANEAEKVFGGYAVGDRMAVLANLRERKAVFIINVSALMGEWVMPNPMDGSSHMGIFIKDGGIAESINMGTLVYLSWRLENGRLKIKSMRDDGANFEEENTYQLLYLSRDSLAIKDSESTFEYRHPESEENYDDVQLDDDDDDNADFYM